MKTRIALTLAAAIATSTFIAPAHAGLISSSFTMEIVVDNDYAIFGGTQNSILETLYQNDVVWNTQIANISAQTFNLSAGNDTIYVLAMGGGGAESLAGELNNVNITDASLNVSMSSNIAQLLSGYNSTAVANGTYTVDLNDVQTAFSGLNWGAPTVTNNQVVVNESGFGSGFTFGDQTARLFRFEAEQVNIDVADVSEPSTLGVLALGLLGFAGLRRKKQK